LSLRNIVVVPHDALKAKAREIRNIDDKIVRLAKDMAETMYKAPGVGLAANQVGEPVQLIVLDVVYAYAEPHERKKEPLILINPRVTLSEGRETKEEGCLSVPDFGLEVSRAANVQIEAVDLSGNAVKLEADGLLARALQHEIDHLKGKTILDLASSLKRGIYRRRLKKRERKDD
jgi:peptide deformylase